ncbi:hypothetical protein GCM10009789_03280 [Kribbella sancticallisti]|uniref:IPT/TIG domain-containing protein n=1 Tax=Kribbella sancticallisti TaxID=460087 RepID=A0ABN2C893_9ACTN
MAEDKGQPLPAYYAAAAVACLAAQSGREDLWRSASSVADRKPRPQDCIDRAVIAFLQRLVTTHRRYPEAQLLPQPSRAGATIACPRIMEISPDHGSSKGGYRLTLVGAHLPSTVTVHFVMYVDDRQVDVRIRARSSHGGTRAVITAPERAAGAAADVIVYPDGWPMAPLNGAPFTFDETSVDPSSSASRSGGEPNTTAAATPTSSR